VATSFNTVVYATAQTVEWLSEDVYGGVCRLYVIVNNEEQNWLIFK